MTCKEILEHASAVLLTAEEIIETYAVLGAFHLVDRYTNALDRCFPGVTVVRIRWRTMHYGIAGLHLLTGTNSS